MDVLIAGHTRAQWPLLSAGLSDAPHSFAYVAVMNGGGAGDRKTTPPPPASHPFTSSGGRRTRPYNQERGAPIEGQEPLCLVQRGLKVQQQEAGQHYGGKWWKTVGRDKNTEREIGQSCPESMGDIMTHWLNRKDHFVRSSYSLLSTNTKIPMKIFVCNVIFREKRKNKYGLECYERILCHTLLYNII